MPAPAAPKCEHEVAKAVGSFVEAALGEEAPDERSLEAFREAFAAQPPDASGPAGRALAELASEKLQSG